MRRIRVSEAEAGMILSQPIIDAKGRTIVKAGAKLTQLYIARLDRWGVEELSIDDSSDALPDAGSGELLLAKSAADDGEGDGSEAPPPGVYQGADLEAKIEKTFAGVIDDPLMATLRDVIMHNLRPRGARG